MLENASEPPQEDIELIRRLLNHLELDRRLWSPEDVGPVIDIAGRTLRRWWKGKYTRIKNTTRYSIHATLARPIKEIVAETGREYLEEIEDENPLPTTRDEEVGDAS